MTTFILFVLVIILGVYAYETRQQVQRLATHIDMVNVQLQEYLVGLEERMLALEKKRRV